MHKLSAVLASAAIATAALFALSGTASADTPGMTHNTPGMTHNAPTMTHNVSTMTHNAPSGYALAG